MNNVTPKVLKEFKGSFDVLTSKSKSYNALYTKRSKIKHRTEICVKRPLSFDKHLREGNNT